MSVTATLQNRHGIHGDYSEQSYISMQLLRDMKFTLNWKYLTSAQEEALILIAVKIGRILTGDQNAADHWHDIAGYAQLVENILNGKQANGVEGSAGAQVAGTTRAAAAKPIRDYQDITSPAYETAEGAGTENWGKGQILGGDPNVRKCNETRAADVPNVGDTFNSWYNRNRGARIAD